MKKIPNIKFVKGGSTKGITKTADVKHSAVQNAAIKKSQPSLQSEEYRGPIRKHNQKAMKIVNHFAKQAAADIKQSIPTFYHPDFEPSSLLLPKDRIEINSWCNYFYKYDALVSTAIDMHSELPLSKIRLDLPKTRDKKKANKILEHYLEMIGNSGIDLFNKLLMMGVEYHKLGNVFPWAQMNEDGTAWERLVCLNPDYIKLEKLPITNAIKIDIVPDDKLRRIVHAGPYDQKTGKLYQTLPEDVIERVRAGREIPLATDPNEGSHCAHIARKLADYHEWGSSLIERNFKTLVYKDRLRQSQDAIAQRHLTPKHLVWADYASKADVNDIRDQVEDAMLNPDFAIVTNYQLHWDLVGTSSGLMQLSSEWQWITDDLLIGLMINKNVLLGEGTFASGQTVLEVLNQRYAIFREQLEAYIEKNLFIPIARNMDFVEYEPGTVKNGQKEILLYPKVRWNRLNLTDDTQHKQMLAQAVAEGKVDVGTWLEYFGLNSESIAQRLKQQEDTVLDPTYMELRRSIMMEVGRTLGPAVAKVYADAYGLELEDPMGGMGMFAKDKNSISKFGKDLNIEYNDDGGITIKPKIVTEEVKKTSDTRDQRRHESDVNKEKKRVENSVEVDTKKKQKPPRKDLQDKNIKPNMFKIMKTVDEMIFDAKHNGNDRVELKSLSKPKLKEGYNSVPFQSTGKTKELEKEAKALAEDMRLRSDDLLKKGMNSYTRNLLKKSENDIINSYYRSSKSANNNGIDAKIATLVPQIYTATYHSLSKEAEPIFEAGQTVRMLFEKEMNDRIEKLSSQIELITSTNRKIAESNPDEAASLSSKAFKEHESHIRSTLRTAVDEIIDEVSTMA